MRRFAIELLEMVKEEAGELSKVDGDIYEPDDHSSIAIDTALEELRK